MTYHHITIEEMRQYLCETMNGIDSHMSFWKLRGEDKRRLHNAVSELETVLNRLGGHR